MSATGAYGDPARLRSIFLDQTYYGLTYYRAG